MTEALALLAELAERGEPIDVSIRRAGITATLSVGAEQSASFLADLSKHESQVLLMVLMRLRSDRSWGHVWRCLSPEIGDGRYAYPIRLPAMEPLPSPTPNSAEQKPVPMVPQLGPSTGSAPVLPPSPEASAASAPDAPIDPHASLKQRILDLLRDKGRQSLGELAAALPDDKGADISIKTLLLQLVESGEVVRDGGIYQLP